jgi:hypothetical protein
VYTLVRVEKYAHLIPLAIRQLRATIHDIDISCVTEQAVAFLCGQFLYNAKLFQMTKGLINCGRGKVCCIYQRSGYRNRLGKKILF